MTRTPRRTATAVAVTALFGLSACVTPHNSLGTKSSSCFQGLPAATAAVHSKGKLVGVRAVSGSTARDVLGASPPTTPTTSTTTAPGQASSRKGVCLFAFKNSYRAADVDHLRPGSPDHGQYAVVAVTVRTVRPVGAVLSDKLPFRFHHLR
jgi:hypothetical protein